MIPAPGVFLLLLWKRRQEGLSGVENLRQRKLLVAKKLKSSSERETNRDITACHPAEHPRGVTTAVSP